MTTNPFNELLVSNFAQEEQANEQKKKKNYIPSDKKQQELKQVNQKVITVINSINPFAPDFDPFVCDGVVIAKALRDSFPFSDSMIGKLDEEGIDKFVDMWEDGIKNTIRVYKDEIKLKDVYTLDVGDLQSVFTSPIIKHTKKVLKNRRSSAADIIEDIYMKMPYVTGVLSPYVIRKLQSRYFKKLQNQMYTQTDIQDYQKLKYKPLDGMLTDVLTDGNYKEFADTIQKLDKFLDFVNIPVKTILGHSLLLIQENIKEVDRLKKEYEDVLVLREDPAYKKPVYAFHKDALKKINKAKKEYEQLHLSTYKALKVLSKVHDKYNVPLTV